MNTLSTLLGARVKRWQSKISLSVLGDVWYVNHQANVTYRQKYNTSLSKINGRFKRLPQIYDHKN